MNIFELILILNYSLELIIDFNNLKKTFKDAIQTEKFKLCMLFA